LEFSLAVRVVAQGARFVFFVLLRFSAGLSRKTSSERDPVIAATALRKPPAAHRSIPYLGTPSSYFQRLSACGYGSGYGCGYGCG
jgi:hypothetical protein